MPETSGTLRLKVTLHLIFFLSGLATVLIGQVLPILARQFSLSDLQLSYFFPAQLSGSLIGTLAADRFARRDEQLLAAIFGGFAMVLGLLTMSSNSLSFCLLGFFVNGLGIGLTLPAINMTVVALNPQRTGAALSILNFCWGVGAIISKPFVDVFSKLNSLGPTTLVLAAPLLIASLLLILTRRAEHRAKNKPANIADDVDIPLWSTPLAWLIALFNFIHVGFESGIGGWMTTYAERVEGGASVGLISPILLYFLFFVIGRGVAPLLFRRLDETKMLFLGLAIILVGVVTLLVATTVVGLSAGAILCGFGTSWIFPTNVSRFSLTFGPNAIRRATPLFLCGTLGAATVTWLIGLVSEQTGDLRSGMLILAIGVVMLLVLQTGLSVWSRQKVQTERRS